LLEGTQCATSTPPLVLLPSRFTILLVLPFVNKREGGGGMSEGRSLHTHTHTRKCTLHPTHTTPGWRSRTENSPSCRVVGVFLLKIRLFYMSTTANARPADAALGEGVPPLSKKQKSSDGSADSSIDALQSKVSEWLTMDQVRVCPLEHPPTLGLP
jgi:hypothetical protein